MKTILTLALATFITTATFAQYRERSHDRDDWQRDRNVVYRNDRMSDREVMIRRINQKYDFKIREVQRNRYMNHRQKRRAIRDLEIRRKHELEQASHRYNNRRYQKGKSGRYNRDYTRRNDRKNW